jgi:hypothetical protein
LWIASGGLLMEENVLIAGMIVMALSLLLFI